MICAFGSREAEQVRRRAGLTPGNSVLVFSQESAQGLCSSEFRVIETPRFRRRPDAFSVRLLLQMSSTRLVRIPYEDVMTGRYRTQLEADRAAVFVRARLEEAERLVGTRRGRVHAVACDAFLQDGGVENCTCGGADRARIRFRDEGELLDELVKHLHHVGKPGELGELVWYQLRFLAAPFATHPEWSLLWRP
ncbi:hypothetical protein [Streptosporangium oxazolinicum]|uniref:hypothetical protein n=1 Tax=Streptosporangium oxazolinicum TaxID=909287 RepID=UPI0031EF109F